MKTMNTVRRMIALAVVFLCCATTVTFAQVPRIITFQGLAKNAAGAPLNGSFNLTFRLYDVLTNGLPLWTETHTNVPINRGIFAVPLGVFTPLSPPFDQQYWISVAVGTNPEMSPREPLTSAPYALRAAEVDNLGPNTLSTVTNILNSQNVSILATVTNVVETQSSNILATVTNIVNTVGMPRGAIVMWSGAVNNVPSGWALCDGQNSRPDLRNRFIVGASIDVDGVPMTTVKGPAMQTGGEQEHTLTIAEMPAHTHTGRFADERDDSSGDDTTYYVNKGSSASVSGSTGGGQPHENCPPFYSLAFIIKQ